VKGVQHMKKYSLIIQILGLACACMISAGCATQPAASASAASPNSGHLLVARIPNFGTFVNLVLSVDGKRVATLNEGENTTVTYPHNIHLLPRLSPTAAVSRRFKKALLIKLGRRTPTLQPGPETNWF